MQPVTRQPCAKLKPTKGIVCTARNRQQPGRKLAVPVVLGKASQAGAGRGAPDFGPPARASRSVTRSASAKREQRRATRAADADTHAFPPEDLFVFSSLYTCDVLGVMKAEELPQLEVFQRVMEIPVVERAVQVSATTYGWLKDSNPLLYWALSSAEATLSIAGRQAAPIARKLETPINILDLTLCRGLDEIEKKMPFVMEKPEEVLGNAYAKAKDTVTVPYDLVSDQLKEYLSKILNISWNSVNGLLNTEIGSLCLKNIESSASLLDMIVEKYIPPIDNEKLTVDQPVGEDRLLHLLQTLDRVSRKMGRRAAAQTQRRLRVEDPNSYAHRLADLLALLGITYALGTLHRSLPSTLDVARFARIYPERRPGEDQAEAAAPQPVAAH